MKNWKWWILGIILILIMPVIPYEEQTTDGVVEVSNQSIAIYLYERYQTTQTNLNKRIMNDGEEPASKSDQEVTKP